MTYHIIDNTSILITACKSLKWNIRGDKALHRYCQKFHIYFVSVSYIISEIL